MQNNKLFIFVITKSVYLKNASIPKFTNTDIIITILQIFSLCFFLNVSISIPLQ